MDQAQEIVKLVAKEAGITEAQAGKAIVSVLNIVKKNVPPALHGPIDAAMKGDVSGLAGLANMAGGIESLLK